MFRPLGGYDQLVASDRGPVWNCKIDHLCMICTYLRTGPPLILDEWIIYWRALHIPIILVKSLMIVPNIGQSTYLALVQPLLWIFPWCCGPSSFRFVWKWGRVELARTWAVLMLNLNPQLFISPTSNKSRVKCWSQITPIVVILSSMEAWFLKFNQSYPERWYTMVPPVQQAELFLMKIKALAETLDTTLTQRIGDLFSKSE